MTTPRRTRPALLLASVLAAPTVFVLAGCEDDAARARAEAQSAIEIASRELPGHAATLVAAGDGTNGADDLQPRIDRAKQALDRIQRDLARLDGAAGGQQAAAAGLAATAARQLADAAVRDAAAIETRHATLRASIASALDAARAIAAAADAREAAGAGASRRVIETARAERSATASSASTRVAELDGPIEELRAENRTASERAAALAVRAADLRRAAREQGWADGRNAFEEAVDLELDAGELRFGVARRESTLAYDLEAEQSLARLEAELARTAITRLDDAARVLEDRERDAMVGVNRSRQAVREIAGRIEEALRSLEADIDGPLAAAYAEAANRLDAAAALAGRAGADGRVVGLRIAELRGRVEALRAAGLAAQADLAERVAATPGLAAGLAGGSPSSLRAEADAARQAAVAALTEARDGARGNQKLAALADAAETTLASLEGRAAASPARRPARGVGDAAASARGVGGFDSAEALLAWMSSIDPSDPAVTPQLLGVLHIDRPDGEQIVAAMRKMMQAMADVQAGIESRFGAAAAEAMSGGMSQGMMAGGPDLSGASIVSNDGMRARLSVTDPDTGAPVEFVNVGGSWKIDATATLAAGGMSPDQALPMMQGLADAFATIAAQLESGAIRTEEQLQGAMMGVMMQIMSRMGGMEGMEGGMPEGFGG